MKKQLTLFTVLTALTYASFAQANVANKTNEDIPFNHHLIRVYQTLDKGFGYDILFDNSVILRQDNHPFVNASFSLKTKEDAIRLAKWQIIQISPTNGRQPLTKQPIPNEVSKQLKIAID